MSMTYSRTFGKDLAVGDTIECWWGDDTITDLQPYAGPLYFPEGTRIASFARNKCGMTIIPDDLFDVTARMGAACHPVLKGARAS